MLPPRRVVPNLGAFLPEPPVVPPSPRPPVSPPDPGCGTLPVTRLPDLPSLLKKLARDPAP